MAKTAKFNLHCHEQSASYDSDTPIEVMAGEYADQGYDVIGVVGHNERPDIETDSLPVQVITGVEHTIQDRPNRIDVVSFPDYNFSFLAHPGYSFQHEQNPRVSAFVTARDLDVDGMEVHSQGSQQIEAGSPGKFVGLANDDAHNTHQIGGSYMTTEVTEVTPGALIESVRIGDVDLYNPEYKSREYVAGQVLQGINIVRDWV